MSLNSVMAAAQGFASPGVGFYRCDNVHGSLPTMAACCWGGVTV